MYADIKHPCLCKVSGALQGKLFPQKCLPVFNISFKPASKRKTSLSSSLQSPSLPWQSHSHPLKVNLPPVCYWAILPILQPEHTTAPAASDPLPPNWQKQRLAERSQPCHAKAGKIQTGKYELSGEEDAALS